MWRRWRYWIEEFSYFSPSLQRATYSLIIIILLLQFVSFLVDNYEKYFNNKVENKYLIAIADSLYRQNVIFDSLSQDCLFTPTAFDPNVITKQQWISLGVNEKVAQRIINYRSKKRKFRKPEDLLKIYEFDTFLFYRLYPYILIDSSTTNFNGKLYLSNKKIKKIEINSSDSLILENLPTIGPILASRIIKYRNLLGGFYSIEQLKEVYGITDDKFKTIKTYIWVDTFKIQKLPFYSASYIQFLRHPYIDKQLAKSFDKIRRNYNISKLKDLIDLNILSSQQAEKLSFYLSFEENK